VQLAVASRDPKQYALAARIDQDLASWVLVQLAVAIRDPKQYVVATRIAQK